MTRTVSTGGFLLYNDQEPAQAQAPAQSQPSVSKTQGMLQEYGGVAKNLIAPSSTGMAEGYNKLYDFATGFDSASAPVNAVTGTTSSGTFGGSNIANAAYGYGGGKLANELFDNKGYSDIGGSLGASVGAAAAVGGTAAGAAMGAQFGVWAGPVGALAGAVLGAAIGSLFGSSGISDSSFRTYSGESSDEVSDFNKARSTAAGLDAHGGYRQLEAGAAYKTLNTFDYGRAPSVHDANLGSIDTEFGKYSIGLIDEGDMVKSESFSKGWLERVEAYDSAFAKLLSPEELELAKKGLAGTAQASKEWESGQEFNVTTSDMLVDRYARIAQLVGRDDLFTQLSTGMTGGEFNRSQGAEMLASVIQANMPKKAPVRVQTSAKKPQQRQRPRITISRPEGVINKAMELNYVG